MVNQGVQCCTVNHVVQQETLDRVFASLADPTRRDILIRLGTGPATISELTGPTGMSLTGMRKHVRALEDSEAPLDTAMAWISFYRRLWARRLDGLDAYLTLTTEDRDHDAPDPPDPTASGHA